MDRIPSVVWRYGLAILSVGMALAISSFLFSNKIQGVEFLVFLVAVAITVWYGGAGPAIFALVLSTLAFNYYFTEPYYSFYLSREDVPYYVVFISFALLITWFSATRHHIERTLLQSRDELQREVAKSTQRANLLNFTHDAILVRDMKGVISYWNSGAEELYGWTAEQAVGKSTHELLGTVCERNGN